MGPDISRHTVIADDISSIDWQAAQEAARSYRFEPSKTFEDGSVSNPAKYLLERWEVDLDYAPQPQPGSENLELALDNLDVNDVQTVHAVILEDLKLLREFLEGQRVVIENDGFNGGGAVHHVGTGAVLSAEIDLRHSECGIDSPYEVLARLSSVNVLDGIDGIKSEEN